MATNITGNLLDITIFTDWSILYITNLSYIHINLIVSCVLSSPNLVLLYFFFLFTKPHTDNSFSQKYFPWEFMQPVINSSNDFSLYFTKTKPNVILYLYILESLTHPQKYKTWARTLKNQENDHGICTKVLIKVRRSRNLLLTSRSFYEAQKMYLNFKSDWLYQSVLNIHKLVLLLGYGLQCLNGSFL